jgi:hypothetical protein
VDLIVCGSRSGGSGSVGTVSRKLVHYAAVCWL